MSDRRELVIERVSNGYIVYPKAGVSTSCDKAAVCVFNKFADAAKHIEETLK